MPELHWVVPVLVVAGMHGVGVCCHGCLSLQVLGGGGGWGLGWYGCVGIGICLQCSDSSLQGISDKNLCQS